MGGEKSGSESRDYFGHCAGLLCEGQIDLTWGFMVNNTLVWPDAKMWGSQIFKEGKTVIYTDYNAYQLLSESDEVPPGYPWSLIANPWTAGTYAANTKKLHNGHLWKASASTSLEPPSGPSYLPNGRKDTTNAVNGWLYVSTPVTWASIASNKFWGADSIVVHNGRLYTTPSETNAEPPASPWVLWKVERGSSPNPLKFTVSAGDAGDGDWFLYWGAPDQELDTVDEGVLSLLGHPPYRNCGVIVGKNIKFGSMTTTPPDCKLLAARKPVQTLITGDATNFDADWQVNPWTFLAERLTHSVFGAGLPDSMFDQTTWQAMADKCAANPERYYISPIYTSLKTLREITADLMSYADAFVFWSIIGTLTAGQWPHDESPPAWTDANTIDMHDLTEKIADSSDGWSGTKDSVTVAFDNIQAAFNSHPISAANLFNRAITRKLQALKVDRPFIVRADQAALWATEITKIEGEQKSKGTLTVRAEKATAIGPGAIFRLTDDKFSVSESQRCTRKVLSAPPTGTVKLTYETERGLAALPYSPTPANPTAPQGPSPAPILSAEIIQLPTALAGAANGIGVLAGRTNPNTSAFETWLRYADGTAFQSLGVKHGFCVSGLKGYHASETLHIAAPVAGQTYELPHGGLDLSGNVGTVQVVDQYAFEFTQGTDYFVDYQNGTVTLSDSLDFSGGWQELYVSYVSGFGFIPDEATPPADLEMLAATLTADQVADNQLLLFAINDDDGIGIFSVAALHAVPGYENYYFLYTVNAYGTDWKLFWPERTQRALYLVRRADLPVFFHASFPGLAQAGGSADFILAPRSPWVSAEITDIYDPANNPSGLATEFSHTFASVFPPIATLVSVVQKPAGGGENLITDFSATNFAATDGIVLVANLSDRNFDINKAVLTAFLGATQITLNSQVISQDGEDVTFTSQFSLPSAGAWDIVCTVGDGSGNSTQTTLCTLHVSTAAAPLPSPSIDSYTGRQVGHAYVRGLIFRTPNTFGGATTTGLTVQYKLVARGAASTSTNILTGDATWTTVTGSPTPPSGITLHGPIGAFSRGDYTLWAKAIKGGSNDSVAACWNL